MTWAAESNRPKVCHLVVLLIGATFLCTTLLCQGCGKGSNTSPANAISVPPKPRQEVTFWHFWGGRDRAIVERIVNQFNAAQQDHFVRAIAMPGNNLDLKFFLAVAGGDPPDLLNHDDPVVADWAYRGVLTPLSELASSQELAALKSWLFPAAQRLGEYQGQLFALCNGLDIRALYCNLTLLDQHDLAPPRTLDQLDQIAKTIAPPGQPSYRRMGFLPDDRRLWAWGAAFGGRFSDPDADDPESLITADSPAIVAALAWMQQYSQWYGPSQVGAFRSGEQALTGAAFPMLADRRYAVALDGQWRVRDLALYDSAMRQQGKQPDKFAVVPMPPGPNGPEDAGWVNGNFFVVPRHARNPTGAWAFAKFWVGFQTNQAGAAQACADGGWIPCSQATVDHAIYQDALADTPLLKEFVRLAASRHQQPTPAIPVAAYYMQQVNRATQEVLYRDANGNAQQLLRAAAERVRNRLREVLSNRAPGKPAATSGDLP